VTSRDGAGADAAASLPPTSFSALAETPIDPATPRWLVPLARALALANRAVVAFGMVALLVASLVLTLSVVTRYLFKASTDWQDEMSVFLLVGATFMCAAYVQSQRGHIGIEAIASLLPPLVNRIRLVFCDLVSFLFCSFFSWKSMLLLHEAWVDGQTTSSSWAPPLWIPYGFMTLGMTLLSLQLLLQLVAGIVRKEN
jgi:TRAP-type C4-dicarboxylate transport system permease small subunit